MYGIGREVYDACGSGMQSIKLSAASFLWKKYNGLFSRSKWMRREPSKDTGLLLLLHLYIFKKKLLWHSVPWVWDGSSCPRGITSLDGSRHTSHAQHLYTYIIYYVKTVMNEYSVYTPPLSGFCSKWIIKWNTTQPRVVRSTFDMVHWFFSAFLDINHKTQTIFPCIIDHIRRNWIIAGTRHQGILKRIVGTRGVRSLVDSLPRS